MLFGQPPQPPLYIRVFTYLIPICLIGISAFNSYNINLTNQNLNDKIDILMSSSENTYNEIMFMEQFLGIINSTSR